MLEMKSNYMSYAENILTREEVKDIVKNANLDELFDKLYEEAKDYSGTIYHSADLDVDIRTGEFVTNFTQRGSIAADCCFYVNVLSFKLDHDLNSFDDDDLVDFNNSITVDKEKFDKICEKFDVYVDFEDLDFNELYFRDIECDAKQWYLEIKKDKEEYENSLECAHDNRIEDYRFYSKNEDFDLDLKITYERARHYDEEKETFVYPYAPEFIEL